MKIRIGSIRRWLKSKILSVILVLILLTVIYYDSLVYFAYRAFHVVSYSTRPFWDKQIDNFTDFTFYGSSQKWSKLTTKEMCHLHGWEVREKPVKVFDAILFSHEMEILEIRLRELYEFVDKFIILESGHTFTGHKKPLYLTDHMKLPNHNFVFAMDKMEVHTIESGSSSRSGGGGGGGGMASNKYSNSLGSNSEEPFKEEGNTRGKMNKLLRQAGIQDDDLLIVSDVDEIPRSEVVELFRKCSGMPDVVQLDMDLYIYSFGFKNLLSTWKAAIHRYQTGMYHYSHGLQSYHRLKDAGWHCSFCFKTISQFQFKMEAYSHAERSRRHPSLTSPDHIQRQICEGQDLYNMWPEAYTFGDLFKMVRGYEKVLSGHDIPEWVVKNQERFHWLLPDNKNCTRPL